MAKKRCPKCQQTLPVACKSCACGHIFIAKKYATSKDADGKETEGKKSSVIASLKRLRPERPKREIPDYEYRDDYTQISVGNGESKLKTMSKKIKLFVNDDDDYGDDEDDACGIIEGKRFDRSESAEPQTGVVKKKRGRPKGSKNKPKHDHFLAELSEDNEEVSYGNLSTTSRKPGRPKGSKNKVYHLPPVPEDKVVIYSIILSDINERWMSQNRIKCLPGL